MKHKISYDSDGTTTEYLFAFPFFQNADIKVALNDQLTTLTYSVVPNEDFSGGTVVFDMPPPAGARIDIFRQVALSRVIDYQPTAMVDPEDLNTDFNFLLAALEDVSAIDVNISQWANIHDNVIGFMNYTLDLIRDKLSGGGVLGIYNNLISVLAGAMPALINDYGSITEPAPNENKDDYGIL